MQCDDVRNYLVQHSDARGRIPLYRKIPVLLHLARCPSCRTLYQRFVKSLQLLAALPAWQSAAVPEELPDSIMSRIASCAPLDAPGAQNPVSFRNWITVGLVIFIALISLPFSLEDSLLLIITLSIFLTLYGSLFIGSHIRELSDHFGLTHSK
ncbi:MAG: hypothetical protein SNJ56_04915 [Termitinemataceae bacterium]